MGQHNQQLYRHLGKLHRSLHLHCLGNLSLLLNRRLGKLINRRLGEGEGDPTSKFLVQQLHRRLGEGALTSQIHLVQQLN